MPALPLKSEFHPTLGELLAPRWRRASLVARTLWVAAAALIVAVIAGAALTLASPTVTHGGPVPFSFRYAGLYRTGPAPGGYARVQRVVDGRLEDSFAVGPLLLPAYHGALGAALAMYASGYTKHLAAGEGEAHIPGQSGFVLRGQGSTQIDAVSSYATYNVFYTTTAGGREMYGRNVLLLPDQPGARRGVEITMLTAAAGNRQVTSPLDVGVKGMLEEPVGTFTLE
jgi:energy-converting hydrogenase Eha subunit A